MVRAVLLLALTAGLSMAADLSGRWVAETPGPDGETRKMFFTLKAEGDRLTGSMSTPMGETPISDGTVSGDEFTFTVAFGFGGGDGPKMVHRGKLAGEELRITRTFSGMPGNLGPGGPGGPPGGPPRGGGPATGPRPGGPGGMARELVARRATGVDAVPPKPLPPVSLPAVRDLSDNGLVRTPPMGWNSYNRFRLRISDQLVRETADALVSTGMKAAGYVYLNIDDGWQGTRDEKGVLQPNERFPDMKALGEYVHSKGLKLGIYSSPGPRTCGGFEGSYGHEEQDARTFAEWGVDYLKYDWCSAGRAFRPEQMRAAYQKMAEALRATGRPIVYSLCQYGGQNVQEWGPLAGGNLWRTTFDIRDTWQSMADIGFRQNGLERHAGPGRWNDPDMLEVGNGGMTDTEYRTHMSLWAVLAAPLIAGNDLRSMTPATRDTLMNPDVIAINQDKLGRQGYRVKQEGTSEVWVKPLSGSAHAVALFNRSEVPARVAVTWAELGILGRPEVRDLWLRRDVGRTPDGYSAEVPAHGVALVRVAR